MITEVKVLFLDCDSCGTTAPCCADIEGWHQHELSLDAHATDRNIDYAQRALAAEYHWTEDGEGKIHCPSCPPLELTEVAKAERARERERSGLTLFDLEGTPS